MDVFYEDTHRPDSRDADIFGFRRPSTVLGLLQEAATQAAAAIGLSREETAERYHGIWVLSRIRYSLKRPLRWDEPVTIRTWHRGGRGAGSYREFDLYVGEEKVGEALSLWVLVDQDTHKLLRLSDVGEFEETTGGTLCRDNTLHKFQLPQGMSLAEKRRMGYSDTDLNGHVNNVKYADFTCDALDLARLGQGRFVSNFQVCYLAECLVGEDLELCTGRDGEGFYVSGQGQGGKARFEAFLTLDNLPGED